MKYDYRNRTITAQYNIGNTVSTMRGNRHVTAVCIRYVMVGTMYNGVHTGISYF